VVVRREPPRQADVLALLDASDRLMASLYPPESNHLLDVGCGASVRVTDREAELKRLFVSPAARGRGIGRAILDAIETEAIRAGMTWMRLETGISQPEALRLYRDRGYVECEAFAPYAPDPLSVFMTRRLG
jgi:putative acetyltransferase